MIDEQLVLWVWKQVSSDTRYIPSKRVRKALAALRASSPRRFEVVQMRAQARTFQEIGKEFNISRQRAKQIFDAALKQVARLAMLRLTSSDVLATSME